MFVIKTVGLFTKTKDGCITDTFKGLSSRDLLNQLITFITAEALHESWPLQLPNIFIILNKPSHKQRIYRNMKQAKSKKKRGYYLKGTQFQGGHWRYECNDLACKPTGWHPHLRGEYNSRLRMCMFSWKQLRLVCPVKCVNISHLLIAWCLFQLIW